VATTERFLAFSCTHAPKEDPEAINWLLKKIEEHKPTTIVHLGDGLEADSASRFPSEADWDLKTEFDSFNNTLYQVRNAAPDATCVFLEGNHDRNLLELNRIDKRLRGLCDWRDTKNVPEIENWLTPTEYRYDRRKGCYRIGQVCFSHGYEANASAGKHEAVYFCNEFGLYVHGHLHRTQPVTQVMMNPTRPLRYWYANPGTLAEMDRDYMSRKRKMMWGQGIIVGEAQKLQSPRLKRCWDAHLEVFRKWDWQEGW
tara:strand:+ start:20496 stop:21263 length:768 start_codon:yes stop_codon:yes gene_type:complete